MSGIHVGAQITGQHHLAVRGSATTYASILRLGSSFDFCEILVDGLIMNLLKWI